MSEPKAEPSFTGGKLKLKGTKDGKIKKKKKKKQTEAEELKERLEREIPQKTAAEKSFIKCQEEREAERILKKAQTPHRERVEAFNEHLDELIEHFDIPKVSWTK